MSGDMIAEHWGDLVRIGIVLLIWGLFYLALRLCLKVFQ